MHVTLEGCAHKRVEWTGLWNGDARSATCLTCYHRLRQRHDEDGLFQEWLADTPAIMCNHPDKKPISEAITRHHKYQDALCMQCGRVLRHHDGPGQWDEVMFYGFVISEEP